MKITLDKLAKDVADKALNDIKLDGKTIREWVEIIAKQQICGDCISREEVIKTVLPYTSGDLIADDIKKLPPVIPKGVTVTDFADCCKECGAEYGKMLEASKPKGGYWISSSNGWMCSNCYKDTAHEYDFCPRCDADMRVTRESKKNYILEENGE